MLGFYACPVCGGRLDRRAGAYACPVCGKRYTAEEAEAADAAVKMCVRGKITEEAIADRRGSLYRAMHEKIADGAKCRDRAERVLEAVPGDYYAAFALLANAEKRSDEAVCSFLDGTAREERDTYADAVTDFMERTVTPGTLEAAKAFVREAYPYAGARYRERVSALEAEAERAGSGFYDAGKRRDAFVAYCPEDAEEAEELIRALEARGVSCFAVPRNVRRAVPSGEDTGRSVKKGMDSCDALVFVSSKNSRRPSSPALGEALAFAAGKGLDVLREWGKAPSEGEPLRAVEYLVDDYPAHPSPCDEEVSDLLRMRLPVRDADGVAAALREAGAQGADDGLERLSRRAGAGDALSQKELGDRYLRGRGARRDVREAVRWYAMAAKQGNVPAMSALAGCYDGEHGLERDETKVRDWSVLAAERGDAAAESYLGDYYWYGLEKFCDLRPGEKPWEKERGHYFHDIPRAVAFYRSAASKGDADAQCRLGEIYLYGEEGLVEKDAALGMKLLEKAAAQGHLYAQLELAERLLEGKDAERDPAAAAGWYEAAALQGNVTAVREAGAARLGGRGGRRDAAAAALWLRVGADAGDRECARMLGDLCLSGEGTDRDEEEAVRLFRSAAEAGDPAAMNRLARCYESGTGVGRDPSEAKMWRDRAFKTLYPGKSDEG